MVDNSHGNEGHCSISDFTLSAVALAKADVNQQAMLLIVSIEFPLT